MFWALGASMEFITIAHFFLELPSFTSSMLTRCVRKVSDLRSYLRVGPLRHPDRGILRSSPHLSEPHAPSGASTS